MTRGFSVENKALLTIMGTNLYPIDHLTTLNSGCSRFLYDLIKCVSIDIFYHIYRCFCQEGSQTSSRNGLLFPSRAHDLWLFFSDWSAPPFLQGFVHILSRIKRKVLLVTKRPCQCWPWCGDWKDGRIGCPSSIRYAWYPSKV